MNLALDEDALFTALEVWFTVSRLILQRKVSDVDFPNALVLVLVRTNPPTIKLR